MNLSGLALRVQFVRLQLKYPYSVTWTTSKPTSSVKHVQLFLLLCLRGLVSDIFVSLALSGFLNSITCCISKLSCDVSFPWLLRSLTKVHSGLFCHFVLYAFMFLCFFQTVLFSSFSGILSLICFTNCPQALWCFTCVHLFLSPLSVYKKNVSSEKHPKSPRISLICLVTLLLFFFFPLNFYVMCFRFPAFLGGDVTLWIWSLYLNLMDSCGFWAVTRERFYIKPSLWSWEILRRTLQLCSPKKTAFPMLPLYAAPTSRLQDCSHALVPALS